MNVYGLIGHPLEHSFSQKYFTEKFRQEGLDCRYELFDIADPKELSNLLKNRSEIIGFNITSPYKEVILSYIDYYNDIVNETKSVNTIKRLPDGKLAGYNTDVIGFEQILQGVLKRDESPLKALVFGTGGASKAVQWVLRQHHISYDLVSRDPQHGNYTYNTISPETIENHRLLINATPLGTYPNVETAPDLSYQSITPDHHLIDLVYNPEETTFLRKGKERGASITNGLTMLYAQAEASWEIWNTSPPSPLMPSPKTLITPHPRPLSRGRGEDSTLTLSTEIKSLRDNLSQRHPFSTEIKPLRGIPFSVLRFPFSILRFPFSVFHSPFSILRFPFSILRFPFSVFRSPFLPRLNPYGILLTPHS